MRAPIYTHISWWIYRTLKTDQSFSIPRFLHLSSSLSTLSLFDSTVGVYVQRGEQLSACACTCVAQVCTFHVSLSMHMHVTLVAYARVHTSACA